MGTKSFYINIMMIKILNLFHTISRRKSMFGIQPQKITCMRHIFQKMEDRKKDQHGKKENSFSDVAA